MHTLYHVESEPRSGLEPTTTEIIEEMSAQLVRNLLEEPDRKRLASS